jgi:hypothetical protein
MNLYAGSFCPELSWGAGNFCRSAFALLFFTCFSDQESKNFNSLILILYCHKRGNLHGRTGTRVKRGDPMIFAPAWFPGESGFCGSASAPVDSLQKQETAAPSALGKPRAAVWRA